MPLKSRKRNRCTSLYYGGLLGGVFVILCKFGWGNAQVVEQYKADIQDLLLNDSMNKKPAGGCDDRLPDLDETSSLSQSLLDFHVFHDREFSKPANALKDTLCHKEPLIAISEEDVVYTAEKGIKPQEKA